MEDRDLVSNAARTPLDHFPAAAIVDTYSPHLDCLAMVRDSNTLVSQLNSVVHNAVSTMHTTTLCIQLDINTIHHKGVIVHVTST